MDPVRRGWNVFRKGKKNHGVRVEKVWVLYKKVWIGEKPDCGPYPEGWSVFRKGKKNEEEEWGRFYILKS